MTVLLFVLIVIGVVGAVVVLAGRDAPVLEEDPAQPRPLVWPREGPIDSEALADARFAVAVRGYRMDQVDRVLADAGRALAERDETIRHLQGRLRDATPGGGRNVAGRVAGGIARTVAIDPGPRLPGAVASEVDADLAVAADVAVAADPDLDRDANPNPDLDAAERPR